MTPKGNVLEVTRPVNFMLNHSVVYWALQNKDFWGCSVQCLIWFVFNLIKTSEKFLFFGQNCCFSLFSGGPDSCFFTLRTTWRPSYPVWIFRYLDAACGTRTSEWESKCPSCCLYCNSCKFWGICWSYSKQVSVIYVSVILMR